MSVCLSAGDNSGAIKTRVNYDNWSDHDESNDYSYIPNSDYDVNNNVTLYYNGTLIAGTPPTSANRTSEIAIADIVEDGNDASLTIYPNPSTSGVFHLSKEETWQVLSMDGTQLKLGNSSIVDISLLPSGSYLIVDSNGQFQRLIKKD